MLASSFKLKILILNIMSNFEAVMVLAAGRGDLTSDS